jgi:D-alanyl-D-alanine carboxypeptidase/D-alanyl-D-alanine-endopeptidase (penicillin-binding protein 4)
VRTLALALAFSLVQLTTANSQLTSSDAVLHKDLDAILAAPAVARALVGVRIESLRTGEVIFQRNSDKLVVPASNMKLLTMAVAAERLGWGYRFETKLEAVGSVTGGTLRGDLLVTGGGDPSIVSPDGGHPALFLEWAEALKQAGIRRVEGRVVGIDTAFDDTGIGAGWAWDYLADGYAAPSGALSYNDNVVTVRVAPGKTAGERASITTHPAGSRFEIQNLALTGESGSQASVSVDRMPGSSKLVVTGRVPAGGSPANRVTTIDNPTAYFVEALRLALLDRGIVVTNGAWDLDDIVSGAPPSTPAWKLIARRESAALSALGALFLKVSQNYYGEMFLKAIGRQPDRPGTAAAGRAVVRETLAKWGIGADSFVMSDGSGLSRYDYVTADTIVTILKHVWRDEKLRGPFLAALPTSAYDGTLSGRMRDTPLAGRVQAKTGTISNMRALSGYLTTNSGERIVFSIIANHFTAPTREIDDVAEKLLLRLVTR